MLDHGTPWLPLASGFSFSTCILECGLQELQPELLIHMTRNYNTELRKNTGLKHSLSWYILIVILKNELQV